MRCDIMVDIETLGTKSDATIFQIAAMAFNIQTGETFDEFNRIADIEKNKNMCVDGSTIKWWVNTDKTLLQKLLNTGEKSSEEVLTEFHTWLVKLSETYDLYLWGNGILFDNKMIQYQMESIGLNYPIKYKNDRDMRTILDMACVKAGVSEWDYKQRYNNPTYKAHDAIDDVRYQIDVVVGCYNELTEVQTMDDSADVW